MLTDSHSHPDEQTLSLWVVYQWEKKTRRQACNGLIRCEESSICHYTESSERERDRWEEIYEHVGLILSSAGWRMTSGCALCSQTVLYCFFITECVSVLERSVQECFISNSQCASNPPMSQKHECELALMWACFQQTSQKLWKTYTVK